MKKIISLFIVAALIATSIIFTTFAASPAITVGNVSAATGDTVEVAVKITGNTGYKAYGLTLDYNTNALELVSVKAGEKSPGFFDANTKNGKVAFAAASTITGDGTLFTATFKVKTETKEKYNITIKWDAKSSDLSSTPSVVTGSVTVQCKHEKTSTVNAKPSTCSSTGYTGDVVCSDCGKTVKSGTTIAKTAHSYNNWTQTKAPSCAEKGKETRTCSNCGHKETRDIAATAHKWNAGTVTKQPTCKTTGTKTFTCTACKKTKTETIATIAHKWDSGTVTKQPGCETTGTKKTTCTVCKKTKTETIPAIGHKWDAGIVTTPPGCETTGVKTFACTENGCIATKTETIAAAGHIFGDYVSNNDATCDKDGTKTATCSGCGKQDTVTDENSKKPHNFVDGSCTDCNAEDPDYKKPAVIWPWILILIISFIALAVAGYILYTKKRKKGSREA